MDDIDSDIITAMNSLNMGRASTDVKKLKQGLLEHGQYSTASFNAVISNIKAGKKDWDTITIDMVLTAFNNKVAAFSVDCVYCRGGGWLKVILLIGRYNDRERTWLFNYIEPEKHLQFLRDNHTFKASAAMLPCVCENGTNRNIKFQQEWMSEEQRNFTLCRSIRFKGDEDAASGYEDYMQEQTIKKINMLKEGIDYQIKQVNTYPSIPELQQELVKSMEDIQN